MKARRILAVAQKEFLHVLRDFRSLGMAIFIPMMISMTSYLKLQLMNNFDIAY